MDPRQTSEVLSEAAPALKRDLMLLNPSSRKAGKKSGMKSGKNS